MIKAKRSGSVRSVSEGDLADVEQEENSVLELNEKLSTDINKQALFTLPRWISGRKKNKNRIKYIKVDVPFVPENVRRNEKISTFSESTADCKSIEKSANIFRKLFRSNSFFSVSSKKSVAKSSSKVPIPLTLSTSNTDIRNSNGIAFHGFDSQAYFKDRIPAVCGIKNHGNTCFMNAVIQCLSNTDGFAEYFVMDHYKMDFMRRNKTHSKKYGTRGEVTEQLSFLLKSLWSCQYYPNISSRLKNLISKYGAQYEGNNQHDAQEFLLWLLDKVHEDLNTAPKQKYKRPKGSLGRSDEDIAAETLANHLRCNNSFVHDLFQGQFRSSICCLGCGQFSNTFDPYLCVSLPVPHSQNIPLFFNIVFLNEKMNMMKVGILMDSQATVQELCEKMNHNFGISKQDVVFTEIINGEFQRTFNDADLVSVFQDNGNIYAIELYFQKHDSKLEREMINILAINVIENCQGRKMFWKPFALEISRESSYKELKSYILIAVGDIMKGDQQQEDEDFFSISVVDGEPVHETLSSCVDLPLYMPIIDQALLLCGDTKRQHLKLIIQWKEKSEYILQLEDSYIDEHPSVSTLLNSSEKINNVSLYDCFDLYFNEERLGVEDAWMCPYCHQRVPCVKQLSLWTVPDVYIVHLKRFKQSSSERSKITTFVEFPCSGLDTSSYMAARNQSSQQNTQSASINTLSSWSPWKRSRSRPYSRWEDNVYDLYAVCNHHGSMQGGHYTGYSSASSTYSASPDHWAFRMPPFLREVTSKSQDDLYDIGNTSSLDRRTFSVHRPFNRATKTYSTIACSAKTLSNHVQIPNETIPDVKDEVPPPPPPAKHYWTVTSV
ncbi:ubiquitin carboxyl-terminal hydrolase 31-like isoform X2 [Stegodyphus dumicola]|uniref:ubiquitin carboxyl-terminal hydrolase 31-like isoform X2 n=1 Tax=Stegodyphus dumicola TaxID=202533 RepID=UPI0015B1B1F7|nr:ubiquitin carboxyl-terminal hydrolase 31-like isoform X2 [Stegodyphus dumicola]